MPAASLIKVPILVTLYQAVHDGKLSLDDRTTFRDEHRTLGRVCCSGWRIVLGTSPVVRWLEA